MEIDKNLSKVAVEDNISLLSLSSNSPRKAHIYEALISFFALIIFMAFGVVVYKVDPHMPMLLGVFAAAGIAVKIGYKWPTIRQFMYDGIGQALQAIIILMIIGVLIGVWISAGVVPSMIFYGLKILNPSIFLVAAVLICSITSLATGTSWGTMGTMGIALMGIAKGLGIDPAICAGAIISGAYFGDKLSPLSDTTNLAPVVSGTDLFTHIKFMLSPTLITYAIVLAIFAALNHAGNQADLSSVEELKSALMDNFYISPIMLLPPLLVIIAIACKVYAIPGIMLGVASGAILGMVFEGNSFGALLEAGMNGFVISSGTKAIDELLNAGGLMAMMPSVSLTILAMMFGGIVEKTGQLEVIVECILRFVKSAKGLLVSTMGTCILSNITMPEQYISVVVPGKMFANAYKERGIAAKTLSNALESGGTVTSALIPWNTCAIFIVSVLGVQTIDYIPFAFFNYLMPVMVFLLSFTGLTIAKIKP